MSATSQPLQRWNPKRVLRRVLISLVDLVAFSLSAIIAFELRFDGALPDKYLHPMKVALCVWAIAKSAAFMVCSVPKGHWRHISAYDAMRIVLANLVGSTAGGLVILLVLGPWSIPRSLYILDWLVSCSLTMGTRLLFRVFINARRSNRGEGERTKTLIYGAGDAGLALVWELRQNQSLKCDVVGLIDDDLRKADLVLHGKRVLGTGEALGAVARKHAIKRLLIAIPSATPQQMVRILKLALDAEVQYKMVPSLGELIQGKQLDQQIRDVAVEDLLGRKPVQLDQDLISERIQGKIVMVTGAAGSIGSEVCRQIARFRPLAIVGFDEAETPLFHLDRDLGRNFPDLEFFPELGNISRPDTLRKVMKQYRPSILYHAAAYKHVPLMEKHIFAAVENNIFGTWQVALAAVENGIEDFVMISTDKAVRPTSMMGATKRVAELVIRSLQMETDTRFVAVRFGNVLGSNGSVVPIFKEQIAAGGPVTVTHPEMHRYFMTIPEAAQLVLQAFSIGTGGEVFVLDMGEPVKILDLARNLILLSGLQPERDIGIQFTGLRPGEKLFEELNLQDERLVPTSHTQIRSYACPIEYDMGKINIYMHDLQRIIESQDVAALILLLKEMVPDYNPGSRLLQIALSNEPNHAASAKNQGPHRQIQSAVATKPARSTQIN
jgi:FlaA1/EpsC-like NDP-sugar epimerase